MIYRLRLFLQPQTHFHLNKNHYLQLQFHLPNEAHGKHFVTDFSYNHRIRLHHMLAKHPDGSMELIVLKLRR